MRTRFGLLALLLALALPAWASPDLNPFPMDVLTVPRPEIGVVVSGAVRNGTWRLIVDGKDFTNQLQRWGNKVFWQPGYDLSNGVHKCYAAVLGRDGEWAEREWTFTLSASGGGGGPAPSPPWWGPAPGPVLPPWSPGDQSWDVFVDPPAGAIVGPRPIIRATFPGDVVGGTAWITVDGLNETGGAGLAIRTLSWIPPYDLDHGEHVVQVGVRGTDGRLYTRSWQFYVR